MRKIIPLAFMLLMPPAMAAPPSGPPDAGAVERQMKGVATLLEASSAARQIEASGKPDALRLRDRAREAYASARAASEAGRLDEAKRLLDEASKTLFEGARLAAPPEDKAKRQQAEYMARRDEARAMLDAHRRVVADKGNAPDALVLVAKVENLLAEAERAAPRDVAKSLAFVDQAYHLSRAAIGSLRGGETLVRSLNFANKEEEYRYELDRHDSHQMLIGMLLKEKRDTPGMDRMVQGFLDKALRLRAEAEAKAGARDFAGAVGLMEEATRELIRALRGAGIYIPG